MKLCLLIADVCWFWILRAKWYFYVQFGIESQTMLYGSYFHLAG